MSVTVRGESGFLASDPARDVLADLLGAAGRGDEAYLVLERAEDDFVQVTLLDDEWLVERRAGGERTHEVTEVADLAAALDVLSSWMDGTDPASAVDWRPLD